MILQRCARQTQTLPSLQTQRQTCGFGVGVLDRLRFVENDCMPFLLRQHLVIAAQQRIGRQHEVVL